MPLPARRAVLTMLLAVALAAVAVGVAGCGGGSGSSSTSSASTAGEGGEGSSGSSGGAPGRAKVVWEEPETEEDALGYELLEASETEAVAKALAEAFELPEPLLVRGVNGEEEGPFYDPEDNSITLPYGFATLVLAVVESSDPEASPEEIGERIGAVNSFILAHEFAHALIANFNLPVLGKEEDAADSIATFVLLNVPGGAEYAGDAAAFWIAFSGRQEPPQLADYADVHSLDLQRADAVLCWVAGSSEASFEEIAELELLPPERLESCPSEYAQLVDSIEQELGPYVSEAGEEAEEG